MAEDDGQRPNERDNAKWQRAVDFLATVRDKQRHRGKRMGGRVDLTDVERNPILRALQDKHNVHAAAKYLDNSGEMARQLFEYFGEMCRRNQVVIPAEISREVHFILAVELLANIEDLNASPGKLIGATVQNGVLSLYNNIDIMNTFGDSPNVVRRAAVNYPSDPEGFLTGVIAKIGELEQDDRFASLRDTPYVFKTAAVSHPSDSEGFLTGVITKIEELEQDDRFASLRDIPGVFKRAAINHPSDSEGFLTGVIARLKELEQDARFALLRDTTNVFKTAAVNYPSDPEGFLTGVIAKIGELERDDRFASLRDTPSFFKKAAVGFPSDPEQFLLDKMEEQARTRINGRNGKTHVHDGQAR